jgi:hypothetical protein
LHPATGQGFAAFHACQPRAPPEGDASDQDHSPRRGSHPSKISPRQQPYQHHCGRCLPAVTVLPGSPPGRSRSVADHHPPKRMAYTRSACPGFRLPCPEGRGSRVPRWPPRARPGAVPPKRSVSLPRPWCAGSDEPRSPGIRGR